MREEIDNAAARDLATGGSRVRDTEYVVEWAKKRAVTSGAGLE